MMTFPCKGGLGKAASALGTKWLRSLHGDKSHFG